MVDLQQADVAVLPFDGDSFDKAFAIHAIYFWSKPTECLEQFRCVLKTGGLLAITILPKDKWERIPPSDVFTLYETGDVEQLLTDTGFREIQVEASPQSEKFAGVCIRSVK